MISIIESIAQAENESRSENIRLGIKYHAAAEHQNFIIGNVMAIIMMRMAS